MISAIVFQDGEVMCEIILVSQTIVLIMMIAGYFYLNGIHKGEIANILDDLKKDMIALHTKFDKLITK